MPRGFACPECGKVLATGPGFATHVRRLHGKDAWSKARASQCPHCQKSFSKVSNLYRHVRMVHGEKDPIAMCYGTGLMTPVA